MNGPRLSDATLRHLPAGIVTPAYDRAAVTTGIVHLGVGAFHRAHQAVVIDDRLAAGERGWGIVAASLRSTDTRDALTPQEGLYTVAAVDGAQTRLRVIGAIREIVVATQARERLLAAMADPHVRIVSLTVTEKGYCRASGGGGLDADHADIRHDLAHPQAPVTAPGLLVEALRRRRATGIAPFTVLCCDNLPANGATVRGILADLARLQDVELGRFIADNVSCPSTMVDRIVPATTDADRAMVSRALGMVDAWPVMTEPFTQWVVEDRFGAGRPRFEESGVEMVRDVAPYEIMKLRLLNGAHSTMAYLGQLAGLETVADVIGQPVFARLIRTMMDDEIGPTVQGFSAVQLGAYKAALIARFGNTALRHRTAQIAMDGSQKMPQRLLQTAAECAARDAPFARVGLVLAAFFRFMTGTGEDGAALPVNDPLAAHFAAATERAGAAGVARVANEDAAQALADRLCREMFAITPVFGDHGRDARIVATVGRALASLYAVGVTRTVAAYA